MLLNNLKTQSSRHVLALAAICLLLPASAIAQDTVPVFTPASTWSVGATQLSSVRGLKSIKLPCVVSTEYDNGFVVRFSGGGNQLLALAIDFRQNVFKQGKKYDAMISIGDGYVKQVSASAFTDNTLIFNLRPLTDFYAAVNTGDEMQIDIAGNVMKFSLGQLAGTYAELEACYLGGKTETAKPMIADGGSIDSRMPPVAVPGVEKAGIDDMTMAANNAPQSLKPEDIAAKPLPGSFNDIVRNSDAQTAPESPQMKAPAARISRAEVPQIAALPTQLQSATWEAKSGEDMKIVLSRWAERAGYDLQWQADQDGKVVQDVEVKGSFEDAVGQLLAENSAATGIGAHVETGAGGQKEITSKISRAVPEPVSQAPAVKASIPAFHDAWNAPAGSNIQTVLNQWAAKAGVAIVWQSYMSVPLKSSVNVSGSFEQAVQTLLDQYSNDSRRPLGQLNIDPETGARTLLMDMGA